MKDSYWRRLRSRRMSRRRLLGGAITTGLGAAGLAAVGCTEEKEEEGEAPTPQASTAALEPVVTRGGWSRVFAYDALAIDTYDPHQTEFGPTYNMHTAVFSKVLNYEDEVQGIIFPDLSAAPDGGPAMPEQVDEETYIIRVRPTAKFHDTPEIRKNFPHLAGRPVTAEDIKYSIERQVNPESPQSALYYRKGQWESVDKIESIDDLTLRITTKGPLAPFLHYLADRNASIIAKELVDEHDEMNHTSRMVGSGPFILDEFAPVQHVRCRRNPEWFAADDRPELGTGRPFLDGYIALWPPESASVEEAAFKTKQVDSSTFSSNLDITYRVAEELAGQVYVPDGVGAAGAVNTRFLLDRPPFNDFRVRKAIHLAIDRQGLGEAIYPQPLGRVHFLPNGPIAWPIKRWAIPQAELAKKPGYRFGTAEREEDLADARKLWEAAGGSEAAGTPWMVWAGVPAYIPQMALPTVEKMFSEVLGFKVNSEIDPTGYTTLSACFVRNTEGAPEGTCGISFGFDNGWIDLDDWLYLYFHTGGSKNSFRLSDPKLDAWLEEQRAEFDYERRHEIGLQIQHYLLDEILAQLQYISQWGRAVEWNYRKNLRSWTWFGHAYAYADVWYDHSDPTFQGRPA